MPKIIKNLREDILLTATEIIEQQGMNNLSLRAIAQRLHIAPATVYNYFTGKEQLIGEIIMGRWQDFLAELDRSLSQPTDTVEALSLICSGLGEFLRPLISFWQMGEDQSGENQITHFHHKRRLIFEELQRRVHMVLLQNGLSPEQARSATVPVTHLLVACCHDRDLNFREVIDTIQQLG